jgi:acyl carrier protein
MDFQEVIRAHARDIGMLTERDVLELSSLAVMDLVVALEEATGIAIPEDEVTKENFATVAALSALLTRIATSS